MDVGRADPTPARLLPWLALIGIGLCWGMTGPLSKLAVSTGHHPVGVTFWNTALGALVVTGLLKARGGRLPLGRRHLVFYLTCGLLGTALPNSLSYEAYRHLPVGIVIMVIALVPMATLAIAWPLGVERPDPRRAAGLALGVAAVLLIALPEASLPDPAQAGWVLLPVVVSISYAAENVYIAAMKPAELGPLGVLTGLSWGALLLLAPAVAATGAWFDPLPLGAPELAIVGITALHLVAYAGFIWLIGRAGPVFAAQVGYVVTLSGVALGMAAFGERHSPWVWAALALMLAGLALVQPARRPSHSEERRQPCSTPAP